ncbi:BLUF domain-containing protein [Solirubrobacter soli]|uniref:BLUF domain-containing protein n=1 Tax=Solirubrobacter soli TaxID=363832 RepID=UPI00146C7150|nr:BLUF domain-containing protein [Solirubrobacter soli]
MFRLIYRSHSRIAEADRTEQLGAIFTTARTNNRRLGVTGALVITEDAFAQTLEGEEAAVRELYESIAQDPRHEDVSVLEEGTVDERTFGRWAMARVSEDGGPDLRLVSNAAKGRIVAVSPDAHVTSEQEEVLAFMRDSITHETLGQ